MATKIDELFVALGLDVNSAQFAKADGALKKLGTSAETTKSGLSRFAAVAGKGVTIAIAGMAAAATAAAYGLGKMVTSSIDAATYADKMSKTFGISAESVQELKFAAEQSGSSFDAVAGSLEYLAKNSDEFSKKGTPASKALEAIGVSAKDFSALSLEDQFTTLADGIARLPDGKAKMQGTLGGLGRSASELIPLLSEGSAGIAQLREEASKFTIKNDAVKGLAGVGNTIDLAKAQFAGIAGSLATKLLPVLEPLANAMAKFLDENGAAIADAIAAAVGLIFQRIGQIVDVFDSLLEGFGESGFVVDQLKQTFEKIVTITNKLWVALKPIAKVIGAIASAALAIILPTFNVLLDILGGLIESVGQFFQSIYDLPGAFKDGVATLWEEIKKIPERIAQAVDDLIDNVAGIPGRIRDALGSTLGGLFGDSEEIGVKVRRAGPIDDFVNSYAAKIQAPSIPGTSVGGTRNVANVTVNANGANPMEVVRVVSKMISDTFNSESRDLQAAAGGV